MIFKIHFFLLIAWVWTRNTVYIDPYYTHSPLFTIGEGFRRRIWLEASAWRSFSDSIISHHSNFIDWIRLSFSSSDAHCHITCNCRWSLYGVSKLEIFMLIGLFSLCTLQALQLLSSAMQALRTIIVYFYEWMNFLSNLLPRQEKIY